MSDFLASLINRFKDFAAREQGNRDMEAEVRAMVQLANEDYLRRLMGDQPHVDPELRDAVDKR